MKSELDIHETRQRLELTIVEMQQKSRELERLSKVIQQTIDTLAAYGVNQHALSRCRYGSMPVSVAGLVARYVDALPAQVEFTTDDVVNFLAEHGHKDEPRLRMNVSCILVRQMTNPGLVSRVKKGRFMKG